MSEGSRDASEIVRLGGAASASRNIAIALWTSRLGRRSRLGKSPLADSPDPQLETEALPRRRRDAEKCAAL